MSNNQKKIILLNPPAGKRSKDDLPILSIGYIASALEKGGYTVKIIDSAVYNYSNSETVQAVLNERPDAVGITCISGNRLNAIEIIKNIKDRNKNIFIFGGGRHFHHVWYDSLKNIPALDVIVRGEGEITAVELLNNYFNSQNLKGVLGIAYREDGKIIVNNDRSIIQNLDDISWPAWHLFDLNAYTATLDCFDDIKSIGVISSRGCPNQCTFCANASFWNFLRLRSPKDFVDEVEFLHKKYGYYGFHFWDDTITIVRSHILGICDEILERKLDILWYARARVNTVDEEILEHMKRAGCRVIGFGIESGSKKVLESIKKNTNLNQIDKAIYLCSKLGIITKNFFIYGLPGENEEDLIKTKKLMLKLRGIGARFKTSVHSTGVLMPILFPGTEMTVQATEEGIMPENFDWSSPIYIDRNAKFGLDPLLPIYEKSSFPIEKVLQTIEEFDKRPSVILKKIYYHYRVSGFYRLITQYFLPRLKRWLD